eukprot:CAMPEP_0197827302 /NCGR_PEP_ID=MMETSP1437-20131217/4110_1 /TAXON_ID=49252 ORGANISM="Eucampia antarctica, Strain CCMP1452" /NCGR_SAMPLE_ID=MMETSP1437 /ASSEMBLY_ACC=CAM_ASM_001096 /LENGTH=740 /DNA_ID=CAMNT_0043428097 /DNA_START=36 /DNA_END=2258 /DNA_ORIENTATION=-
MPVYLCRPGWNADEPWRHGVQVYAFPFPIPDSSSSDRVVSRKSQNESTHPERPLRPQQPRTADSSGMEDQRRATEPTSNSSSSSNNNNSGGGVVIRRVRHSEVVLVDEVSIAHDRYWLRLRWPGPRGGLAGFIALGCVHSHPPQDLSSEKTTIANLLNATKQGTTIQVEPSEVSENNTRPSSPVGSDNDDAPIIISSDFALDPMTSSGSTGISTRDLARRVNDMSPPRCESTGLYFPYSSAMELLATYDDELSASGASVVSNDNDSTNGGEPVFCRICREGLHDVNYDTHDMGDEKKHVEAPLNNNIIQPGTKEQSRDQPESDANAITLPDPPSTPPIITHHPYAENPLLAPCQCTGSMAFVHYLCVEQWRCRSNHPTARNGLNCETCEGVYTLPPPPSRPVGQTHDDWEAMPPHVLAALRRPHITWQVVAAIVRRRWLRPLAPVIISPIVALYCRARRLLKKRGVSRRRWACSLCRRRARWKCVRCLRSYYCSRQCQNVSWHIVHKHVCYKPARFWWSVVVYGVTTIACFPGIFKDPFIYDLGVLSLLASFTITGIIGGGVAQCLKKFNGVDIRGRALEAIVVLSTLLLAWITWGLVWAFFGESNQCLGVNFLFSSRSDINQKPHVGIHLTTLHSLFFRPAKVLISMLDKMLFKTGPHITKIICSNNTEITENDACLRMARNANPDFFLSDTDGPKCTADLNLVTAVWFTASAVLVSGQLFKRRERERRAAGRHRPHQD